MSEPMDRKAFDADDLLERIGGDAELLDEILGEYRSLREELAAAVKHAAAQGDAEALERAAHNLKGMLLALSANPAAEAAQVLEVAGRTGGMNDTLRDVTALERELAAFDAALDQHSARRRAA